MEINRVLSIQEVCDLIGMSKSTIYRLIKKGQFPNQIQMSQRRVGFRTYELLEWIENK